MGARLDARVTTLAQHAEARASTCGAGYDREIELLDEDTRARERVMLGLRLDEPLPLDGCARRSTPTGLARAEQLGLAVDGGETARAHPARAASSAAR